MKNIWNGKRKKSVTAVGAALFLAGAAAVLWFGMKNNSAADERYMLNSIGDSVKSAAVLCYSTEGAYPEGLQYLEDNYGITYNKDEYIVHYSSMGANMPPSVTVTKR